MIEPHKSSAVLCLLALAFCTFPVAAQEQGEAAFHACERDSRTLNPSLVADARCSILYVPENHLEPEGRQLALKIMLIPAIRAVAEEDPLFMLAGGPGEAATETVTALLPAFARIRQDRDIVLFDQRGTGSLSPFNCNPDTDSLSALWSVDDLLAEQEARLTRCLNELEDAGVRAEYYTTDMAVHDIEAVRRFLGYEELNLWGGSYGSRLALAYMQAYPEQIRSLVVDGVAPPDLLFTAVQQDASIALERVLVLCAEDAGCNERFPLLRSQLESVLDRLASARTVQIRHARSGEQEAVELSADVLRLLLTQILYSREFSRLLPLIIEALYEENYQVLAVPLASSQDMINQGMHYSVICNEDYAYYLADSGNQAEPGLLTAELGMQARIAACELWPKRELAKSFFDIDGSERPVLLLSGAQDPVTPPRHAERVAAMLPAAKHLVIPGLAHISSHYPCVRDIVAAFIAAADSSELDVSCLQHLQPRPFFETTGGAP